VGDFRRTVGNRITKGSDLEAVGQRAEGWGVAGFPRLTKSDDADAKFHSGMEGTGKGVIAIRTCFNFRILAAKQQDELYAAGS
jgi:hypothetical protein